MPASLERSLARSARKAGIRRGTKRWRRYVYGTLNRIKRARRRGRK